LNGLTNTFRKDKEFYIGGCITFFIALAIYIKTMSPTVSFWDCGEFISCAYTLAVPHPPGAPFFIILGRFFSMLPFFSNVAVSINFISVLSTAFTILLAYFVIIQLAKSIHGRPRERLDKILMYGAASIGALCFAFTDTLWFNAVEAEVYALSMLFTALVFWLALKWLDTREELSSLKFLLFIVYIFGLAFGVHLLNLLVIPSILLLILFYQPKLLLRWQLWCIVPLIWLLGATTYLMILVRSGLDPNINMNDPSTLADFWYYFSRKQYGSQSLFLTIFDRKAPLWDYQIKYMYTRYFAWNFIGKGTELANLERGFIADTISLNGLKGFPFLLGIIGLFYHWTKDWKKALTVLTLFIIAGLGIVIYLNQPDPQPRERDYVYVGSFFAFSLWIGLGAHAILKSIKRWLENGIFQKLGLALVAGVLILIGPANEFMTNFKNHDRTGNYVAWDYAYNLLTGLEQDAIVFTNGDNDTFPLWYIQEVEGIRKDIKIVNLSLLNTNWYIMHLKHYEPKISIGLPDEDIMQLQPVAFKTQEASFKIPNELIENHYREYGEKAPENLLNDPYMRFTVEPTLNVNGVTGLKLQDQMVLQIVTRNISTRPIYFAITVDPTFFVGLRPFFRMDGLSYKLTPVKNPRIREDVLRTNIVENYRYTGVNERDIYLDFGSVRLLNNYRNGFMALAQYYYNIGEKEELGNLIDSMLERIPEFRTNFRDMIFTENIGKLYWFSGRRDELKKRLLEMLSWKPEIPVEKKLEYCRMLITPLEDYETAQSILLEMYESDKNNNQYVSHLLGAYEAGGNWQEALDTAEEWLQRFPDDAQAKMKSAMYRDSIAAQKKKN